MNAARRIPAAAKVAAGLTAAAGLITLSVGAQPLRFTGPPQLSTNGSYFLSLSGPTGAVLQVEASTDLVQWTVITTLTNASGLVRGTDTNAALFAHRFYRAVPAPPSPSGMVLIPAGSFTMGDSLDGDSGALPLHTVYVSAFYLDKYDVTLALWQQVYNWAIGHGYSFDDPGSGEASNHPVGDVNWYDCAKWCNARSEMEGRTPAYYTSAGQTAVYRTGDLVLGNSWVNWNAGYRLPTEAEWEKAARGGLSGQRFPWGDTISESQANYYSYWQSGAPLYSYDVNSYSGPNANFDTAGYPYTSPVGYFAPNGYGLYDMAGNVWQWCWDWWGFYGSSSQTDPRGPGSGSRRVRRGGFFGNSAFSCREAFRFGDDPADTSSGLGFRSVLPPGQP